MTDEILYNIDMIDEVVLESEMNVMNSIIDTYLKTYAILENYEGDNLEAFSIFQESSYIMEDGEGDTGNKKEGMLKTIMFALPRFIKKCIDMVIKKISGSTTTTAPKTDSNISNSTPSGAERQSVEQSINKIEQLMENIDQFSDQEIKEIEESINKALASDETTKDVRVEIQKNKRRIHFTNLESAETNKNIAKALANTFVHRFTDGSMLKHINELLSIFKKDEPLRPISGLIGLYTDYLQISDNLKVLTKKVDEHFKIYKAKEKVNEMGNAERTDPETAETLRKVEEFNKKLHSWSSDVVKKHNKFIKVVRISERVVLATYVGLSVSMKRSQ